MEVWQVSLAGGGGSTPDGHWATREGRGGREVEREGQGRRNSVLKTKGSKSPPERSAPWLNATAMPSEHEEPNEGTGFGGERCVGTSCPPYTEARTALDVAVETPVIEERYA